MIGWVLKRFRWALIGWGAKSLAKRGVNKSVDRATSELEDRLPEPVRKVAERLPGDVVRAGGTAKVAFDQTRSAGGRVKAVAGGARNATGSVGSARRQLRDRVGALNGDVRGETESARRRIKSEMLAKREGPAAALDALLDIRDVDETPLPEVPDAVERGRRRHRKALPEAPVNRVQRSYRRAVKAWDR